MRESWGQNVLQREQQVQRPKTEGWGGQSCRAERGRGRGHRGAGEPEALRLGRPSPCHTGLLPSPYQETVPHNRVHVLFLVLLSPVCRLA